MLVKGKRIPLILTLIALFWFSMYSYSPIFTSYIKEFSTPRIASLIISSYGFTQMLARIPIGILSDRMKNRKMFVTLGFIFAGVGALGLGLVRNQYAALLFRGMTGLTAATWVPFTILYSSYYNKEKSAAAIGFATGVNFSGQLVAQLLGGALADSLGRQYAFYLAVAIASAGLVMSFFSVDQDKADFPEKPLRLVDYLSVSKDGLLIISSVLSIFMMFMAFATIYGYSPIFAEYNAGASDTQLGYLLMIATLPSIFASFFLAKIVSFLGGYVKAGAVTFLISIVYCIAIPFIKTMWLFFAFQVLYGFARGLASSLFMGCSIRNIDATRKATAMGFYQAIYGIGMTLGPIVVGLFDHSTALMADLAGLQTGFLVVAAVQVVGLVMCLTLFKKYMGDYDKAAV